MNDATPTPDPDELVRRALQAEAEGVEASEALLDRTLAAARRPAARPGRRLLAAAAVAAIAIGAGVLLTQDDDEGEVDVVDDPTSTTTSTVPTTTTTIATTLPAPTGERPTTVVLVREDGWLVVVDLDSGEERELHFGGDPAAPPTGQEEGGPQFIDAVELSPDGQSVYFSTCCEPASGVTYRIPVTGGDPEEVTLGSYPRISPDGQHLATSACQFVSVHPLDGGESTVLEVDECVGRLAWAPDGRQLAATTSVGPGQTPQVLLFDWDGTSLTPADPGKPDNPGTFVAWDPDGMRTTISGGGSVDSSRSLSQDRSYLWLLWVDAEGVVREQASLHSGELPEVAGLPEALAADW